jgi:site-specific DNA-methyltransferase (adenine-specific)
LRPYYEHNGITIYHGDCREILPQLLRIDAVVSDPPYGISLNTRTLSSGRGRHANKGFRGHDLVRDFQPIVGDDEAFDPRFLLGYERLILWGAINYADRLPTNTRWLIWDKRCGTASDDNADCELAWTNLKGQARIFHHYWRGWLREGRENLSISGAKLHPAQKPINLMKWCFGFVPEAKRIADPYMGSGTTLEAAKELGLQAIGIEIHEPYCEIAAKRLSQEVFDFSEIGALGNEG